MNPLALFLFLIGISITSLVIKVSITDIKEYGFSAFIKDLTTPASSFTIVGIIIGVGLSMVSFVNLPTADGIETRQIASIPITSLKLSQYTAGTFLLGTGELEGKNYYKFYKQSEHGNLKFDKVKTSKVEVKRSDTELPQLATYAEVSQYTTPWKTLLCGKESRFNPTYQVLVIPTNAIEIKYDANL
jgi:hypothetical protein